MIDDLTSNGYVRRWAFVSGEPRCVEDAVPSSFAGAVPALQRNAAVRVMIESVTAYEAALRVPTPEEGADTADHDAAQAVIAGASEATIALATVRAAQGPGEAAQALVDEELARLTALPLAVDPRPVPVAVSPLQWRKALRNLGLKPAIDAFIAAADDETREAYEYAVEYRRDDPTLNTAAELLGKSSAELDDLFRHASAL